MSSVSASQLTLGCAALVGLVVLTLVLGNSSAPCPQSSTHTQLRRLPAPPETSDSCRKHDGKSALIIPMRADDNGIFIVNIGVQDEEGNTQWIKAAVDTGSEAMLVAGDECTGCEEGIHMGTICLLYTSPSPRD